MCLSVRFHSRKRQPRERDRGDGFEGVERVVLNALVPRLRGRLRRMMFAPSVTIVAIVFGAVTDAKQRPGFPADPPLLRLARDTRATTAVEAAPKEFDCDGFCYICEAGPQKGG